jgi:hypothetical protein
VHDSVDREHPWLGLASFTEETRSYFYGREEEVDELVRRVQRKLLTVLFGQSGLGKTSILRAGIVPRLRPMGYCPVYVRLDYSLDSPSPSDQIKEGIFRATRHSGEWTQTGVAVAGESLWEFLHHRGDILRDESGKTMIPLLIFDQFEEIFTLAQGDDAGRRRAAQFLEDLADLVENRPPKALEARMESDETTAEQFDFTRSDYRILIALREDYLAHLEVLKGEMPSITQNRMRLARMTGEQALSAVTRPGGRLVSEEVAEAIVRFIAGGSELRNADVEPSLLSLVCRELNNARIAQGRSEISADLLAGSHDTILAEFYERALADQPATVRHFIEDELLTESGFRESIGEERVQKAFSAMGAAPDALATLVDRRLLRIEERLDLRRVELTHDVLCSVVRASRDLRHEREARDEAERKLAEQRERERATRRALVRARKIATVCVVLAIGAVASAIFGYVGARRAEVAESEAKQTRLMADNARGEAEKLIVYLLDDFYRELEPVGRLDVVAQLARRAVEYYDALPAELRTPESSRNRALALVRYGAVLRNQSKLDESDKVLADGVSVLRQLQKDGDHSEITAIGLSLGLISQARAASSRSRVAESQQLAVQAVDVLKPLMAAPTRSIALRRADGDAMTFLGFSQVNYGDEAMGVASLETARQDFRSIADLSLDNLPSAAAYAEASAWQVSGLRSLGRQGDAEQVGEAAAQLAAQVLEKRPGHLQALRAHALINSTLGEAEADALHLTPAVARLRTCVGDWESFVKIDPTNNIAWNNLAACRSSGAYNLWRLGRIAEARDSWHAALDVANHTPVASFLAANLVYSAAGIVAVEAEQGNARLADAANANFQSLIALAIKDLPADSFPRAMIKANGRALGYYIPTAQGDYRTVRAMAQEAVDTARRIETANPPQERARNQVLVASYDRLADAQYRLGDYTAAWATNVLARATREKLPANTFEDRRERSDESILAAMIAARQMRYAEARAFVQQAIAFHRSLIAAGSDNLRQHVELANALYASALASPDQAQASLNEAAAILEGLPAEMRRERSIVRLRDDIAAEQTKRR